MQNLIVSLLMLLLAGGCGAGTPSPQTSATSQSSAAQVANTNVPDENAALDAIAKITDAQANYFRRNRRFALSFDELVESHLLGSDPAGGHTGYEFKLRPAADAQTYKLSVNPTGSSATARHFFTNESSIVHADTGKDATEDSPRL